MERKNAWKKYTEEEKAEDPSKEDTGLFFFRGKPGEKFAVTNAGGGFMYVAAMHDSFPHMQELAEKGYNAFALIYRPGAQTACEDLARAIAFIQEHAEELQVDTEGAKVEYVDINGNKALVSEEDNYIVITWKEDEYFFKLSANEIDKDTVIKIAKSAKKCD